MEPSHYPLLIHKHLTGEITPAEQLELDRWLREDDSHRSVLGTYTRIWQISPAPIPTARMKQQRVRLLKRVYADVQQAQRNTMRIHRIAAILVFFVASITLIFYGLNTPVTITASVKQNVWLSDSARIILQPKAMLSFHWSPGRLNASFDGEGLFDLVQRATVTLPEATVHAAASSFFIRRKPDGHVLIEVLSGEVTVTTGQGEVVLHANQQCMVDETGPHVSRLHARGS